MRKIFSLMRNRITYIRFRLDFFVRRMRAQVKWRWYQLWVREDEFHISVSLDSEAVMYLNEKDYALYMQDVLRRRKIAHERDLLTEK